MEFAMLVWVGVALLLIGLWVMFARFNQPIHRVYDASMGLPFVVFGGFLLFVLLFPVHDPILKVIPARSSSCPRNVSTPRRRSPMSVSQVPRA